jgi:hypothetical protein
LPEGEFIILLDAAQEPISMKQLDSEQGNILLRVQAEGVCRQYSNEVAKLVLERLLIPKLMDRGHSRPESLAMSSTDRS